MFGLDYPPLKLFQISLSPCKPKRIKYSRVFFLVPQIWYFSGVSSGVLSVLRPHGFPIGGSSPFLNSLPDSALWWPAPAENSEQRSCKIFICAQLKEYNKCWLWSHNTGGQDLAWLWSYCALMSQLRVGLDNFPSMIPHFQDISLMELVEIQINEEESL